MRFFAFWMVLLLVLALPGRPGSAEPSLIGNSLGDEAGTGVAKIGGLTGQLDQGQKSHRSEATGGAELYLAKVGESMLSKKQRKELSVMVGRFAQIEIILESCQRRSNIQRRIIKAASPCVERATLKRVRRQFRNKLAYYRKRVVALDCQAKDVKALLRAGRKAVDQVVSHVRKQCNACFFC